MRFILLFNHSIFSKLKKYFMKRKVLFSISNQMRLYD